MIARLKTPVLAAGLGLALVAGWAAGATAATPDLTGIWKAEKTSPAIKTVDGKTPPLLPEARALYDSRRKPGADRGWDITAECLPPSLLRTYNEPGEMEIVQRPYMVAFLFDYMNMLRAAPTATSQTLLYDTYLGQAISHWEGPDLVVESIGFHDNTTLDDAGMPHSEDLKVVERMKLLDGGKTLEDRIHVEDPKTFSKPWDTVVRFRRVAWRSKAEDICVDRPGAKKPGKPVLAGVG